MGVRRPTRQLIAVHTDSRVWDEFERRPGDIFVATPPKSGTTLTQGIVASLLWADGEIPGVPMGIGLWVDLRYATTDDIHELLGAQDHRRFIKTHSPADAIPIDDECSYITVHRDLRDVIMSWANHRTKISAEVMTMWNQLAAVDGVPPLEAVWRGDIDRLIDELETEFLIGDNLRSWWAERWRPNVLLVHYNDLRADLEGEMRRIAAFLQTPVSEDRWPTVVQRCTLDSMREHARQSDGLAVAFDGGADSFFHKGTNGRWAEVLTDAQLDRIASLTSALPPDAAAWLEHGSLALGHRP